MKSVTTSDSLGSAKKCRFFSPFLGLAPKWSVETKFIIQVVRGSWIIEDKTNKILLSPYLTPCNTNSEETEWDREAEAEVASNRYEAKEVNSFHCNWISITLFCLVSQAEPNVFYFNPESLSCPQLELNNTHSAAQLETEQIQDASSPLELAKIWIQFSEINFWWPKVNLLVSEADRHVPSTWRECISNF